ncbi:hypothetical protein BDR07DRAFT_1382271 [Suillus spraguei]|nr:hypothetical protein BDR07DRAFT_1382271 [Suillus spraguei]
MSDSVSLSTNPQDREIDLLKPNIVQIGIDLLELEKEINFICEYAMYFDSDEESDDKPEMTISDVLKKINGQFPVLDFHQYQEPLCCDGIAYLAAVVKFDHHLDEEEE